MSYRKKREGDHISWIVIIIGFMLFPLLGVALLLVKLFGTDKLLELFGLNTGSGSIPEEPLLRTDQRVTVDTQGPGRVTVDTRVYGTGAASQASSVQDAYRSPAREAVRSAASAPKPKKSNARWLKIIGAILAVVGVMQLGDVEFAGFWRENLEDMITALAFLIGGGAMFLKGRFLDRDMKRYGQYLAVIGEREAVSIEELARTAGYSKRQVEKDLRQMAENGYFGDGAYLNMELGYLFRSNEADAAWREQQRQAQERAVRDHAPKEAEEGYSGILRNIRRANDAIADPVLSAKIDQLESITARILHAMEQDPEKAKRMDKFLTYYLPTTQKLLDSYAQFEAVGVEGENLSQAKARISDTMDRIIQGFSHQLDELYKADAMDVDSDIRVMESMLRRDTGSVSDDFGMK